LPLYERPINVWHRNRVLLGLQALWPGSQAYPHDGLAPIDGWVARKGRVRVGVEIKRRSDRYGMTVAPICNEGYMIDLRKITVGLSMAKECAVRFVLAVDLVDGLWTCSIEQIPVTWRVGDGGRYDRGDDFDVDECLFIPSTVFKRQRDSVTR
jgi:hypothetical protein